MLRVWGKIITLLRFSDGKGTGIYSVPKLLVLCMLEHTLELFARSFLDHYHIAIKKDKSYDVITFSPTRDFYERARARATAAHC